MKNSCFFCVIVLILSFSTSTYAQWGSGYDDYTTPNINEGAFGSNYGNRSDMLMK